MQKKPLNKPGTARLAPARQVRIIGGQWKRTPLPVLDAAGLRPTPDRVRETAFNWIDHLLDGAWSRLDCLDLFAGSGALGLEAASRGARAVTLVEAHTPALRQLEAVKAKLNAAQVTLVRADALACAQGFAARGQRFDLIFLDPPYHQDWLARVLPLCERIAQPGALVYAEAGASLVLAAGEPVPAWLAPWEVVRAAQAGLVFYHLLRRRATGAAV